MLDIKSCPIVDDEWTDIYVVGQKLRLMRFGFIFTLLSNLVHVPLLNDFLTHCLLLS